MNPSGIIKYGTELIRYDIIFRPARRTLGIEVHPDGAIIVLAPEHCDRELLQRKLQHRAPWISRQLRQFAEFPERARPPQYLGGETFRYLGKRYRLRMVHTDAVNTKDSVRLTGGRLVVCSSRRFSRERVRALVERWYRESAHDVFTAAVARVFAPFSHRGIERPELSVRVMKRRWGSLSSHGRMTLNVKLVEAPRQCVEYVITHELCHLVHHDHGTAFWKLLTRIMPDWERRKKKLEQTLSN